MTDYPQELTDRIRAKIRDVPDFPKPGIIFKDLTPVWGDGPLLKAMNDAMAERYSAMNIDVFAGIEARGFICATPVASALSKGVTLLRKPNKLPWNTVSRSYDLEYGQDSLEMHEDGVLAGQRVVILDDLLATGGTMGAAVELVKERGGEVVEVGFVVELAFLGGRNRIGDVAAASLVTY